MTNNATDSTGGSWHDLSDRTEGSDFFVEQAVKYLDTAGILTFAARSPWLLASTSTSHR
jgi:hypothetical protein